MKILKMTLKKKWFDMILSGEKKEDYREIKPYWESRLKKEYDAIEFKNGYKKDSPFFLIEFKGLKIGKGKKKWGAPDYPIYILKLGDVKHLVTFYQIEVKTQTEVLIP